MSGLPDLSPSTRPQLESNQALLAFIDTHGTRLVLLAAVILFAVHISPYWDADPDTASYLSIARNLAAGKIERLGSRHLLYTPVYPAFISPAFLFSKWLGGTPFLYISIIHGILSLLLVLGVRAWAAVYSLRAANLIAILSAVNLGIWSMHRVARPEIAFIAATFWAGALLARAIALTHVPGQDELPHSPRAPSLWIPKSFWWLSLSAALLAALAAAIRPLPFVSVGAFFSFLYFADLAAEAFGEVMEGGAPVFNEVDIGPGLAVA